MNKKPIDIEITSEYITLSQFLKFIDLIQTGGEAKNYLASHEIIIEGVDDRRRGRKLRDGMTVIIEGQVYRLVRKC